MHRALLIGLISAGLLSFNLAAPAQAMKPASNAELRACLGLYTGGHCDQTGPCGTLANSFCIANGYGCVYIMAGPASNTACDSPFDLLHGCKNDAYTGSPCEVYQIGTCSVNTESGQGTCVTNGKNYDYGNYDICLY
jgi:hypothetical protein